MNYKIYSKNPSTHLIDIEAQLTDIQLDSIELQLPSWRPGRYELQNFAKNIQQFSVFDENENRLNFFKIRKDRWKVETKGIKKIIVRYSYFAKTINAGSSFVDENILYVNPVNLCIYAEGRMNENCFLEIEVTDNQLVAGLNTALKLNHSPTDPVFKWEFHDFYHLADSPFIVSASLKHDFYEIKGIKFHLWFEGKINPDFERIKKDFTKFTKEQIKVFGQFPEKEYHFITWILPTAFYHGVEHRNSTMQVLGPDNQDNSGLLPVEFFIDLLGLASHELFHTWNICKMRPVELLPYDFTKENYFKTCFIAEGITTYYGDLILFKSGIFDEKQYQKELEVRYKQHFDNSDAASQSLLESSYDLWLDGYSESIPNRKVSVYHKGAIVAQILDLHIQFKTKNKKSLDDVMKLLWKRFGKSENGMPLKGYSYQDYQTICEEVAGENLDWYFEKCIESNQSLWNLLNKYLEIIGLETQKNEQNLTILIKK